MHNKFVSKISNPLNVKPVNTVPSLLLKLVQLNNSNNKLAKGNKLVNSERSLLLKPMHNKFVSKTSNLKLKKANNNNNWPHQKMKSHLPAM
jgi:hypothetical protein